MPFLNQFKALLIGTQLVYLVQWDGDDWNGHLVSDQLTMETELQELVLKPVGGHLLQW